MPTVLRKDGFAFRIYFNDHIPAHVHVLKASGEVKISLGDTSTSPKLLTIDEMGNKDAKRALAIAVEHQFDLLKAWIEIHG